MPILFSRATSHSGYCTRPFDERTEDDTMVKEISCQRAGIDCAFLIRSDDIAALVDVAQNHCSEQHGVDVSEADLRERSVEV